MTVHRFQSRLEKLERRIAGTPRRYFLYADEVDEIARAEAEGRRYATGPRVLATSEEWERIYRVGPCSAH
jgi:hypothetical protein